MQREKYVDRNSYHERWHGKCETGNNARCFPFSPAEKSLEKLRFLRAVKALVIPYDTYKLCSKIKTQSFIFSVHVWNTLKVITELKGIEGEIHDTSSSTSQTNRRGTSTGASFKNFSNTKKLCTQNPEQMIMYCNSSGSLQKLYEIVSYHHLVCTLAVSHIHGRLNNNIKHHALDSP